MSMSAYKDQIHGNDEGKEREGEELITEAADALPHDDIYTLDDDIRITPARLRRARNKCRSSMRSSILCVEDVELLKETQLKIKEDARRKTSAEKAAKAVHDWSEEAVRRKDVRTMSIQLAEAKKRARSDRDTHALGFQPIDNTKGNSLYLPLSPSVLKFLPVQDSILEANEIVEHETIQNRRVSLAIAATVTFDCEDHSHVRKPDLTEILEDRDASATTFPSLKKVLLSRRFHLYKYRFSNCQYMNKLCYPTLPQPKSDEEEGEAAASTEMRQSRSSHRFIIAADTQFGILMDGFAMENPNWMNEIEISRRCVEKINSMEGADRPLFVCVCGDLVDTESSFNAALASWKKIMKGWERQLIFEQQAKDFKRVWSKLDEDIALVCLCGNHDVGNRPTAQSIQNWTSAFGSDYLAFWVNGTYNIAMNNCLFSNPTGAPQLFNEQLEWLEQRLKYAQKREATQIFVYSHFPWFLSHEDETEEETSGFSRVPEGWGENTLFEFLSP